MAQIKIYGLKHTLNPIKAQLSDIIHGCVVETLKFQREANDFLYPTGRSKLRIQS